jgi:glycosyltransferase involved in cell wall biosynthesis
MDALAVAASIIVTGNPSEVRKRVLVFNFFAGVLDRGIPLYAQDVATCMRRVGLEVIELRCPHWLGRAPRVLLNALFVVFEQVVAPLVRIARSCAWTIYPYNSAGVLDALQARSVLVLHDLISNHRRNTRFAARYIRTTQAVHRLLSRPVCAASPHTLAQLHRLPAFHRCSLRLWSNPFYSFEQASSMYSKKPAREPASKFRILLCSGMGRNKDYAGALKLFRKSRVLANAELRIVGFGDDAGLALRRVQRLPEDFRERIHVLPRLSLQELVEEYVSADVVWVHSRKEGFGRCIIEALLLRRPVVASDIGAFRKLKGLGLQLYRNDRFDASLELATSRHETSSVTFDSHHVPLEAAVRELLASAA